MGNYLYRIEVQALFTSHKELAMHYVRRHLDAGWTSKELAETRMGFDCAAHDVEFNGKFSLLQKGLTKEEDTAPGKIYVLMMNGHKCCKFFDIRDLCEEIQPATPKQQILWNNN